MNISQRIDRLPVTGMLWQVLMLTGIGWLFDAMDQGMVAGVMAAIGKEWQLQPSQLGLLGSAGAVGMALGAAVAGMASDKWGLGRSLCVYSGNVPDGSPRERCRVGGCYRKDRDDCRALCCRGDLSDVWQSNGLQLCVWDADRSLCGGGCGGFAPRHRD